MPAPPSAEQIARCQRADCLFPIGGLTPDEVRQYRGCRCEQGDAFGSKYGNFDLEPRPARLHPTSRAAHLPWRPFDTNKVLTMRMRSGNVGI